MPRFLFRRHCGVFSESVSRAHALYAAMRTGYSSMDRRIDKGFATATRAPVAQTRAVAVPMMQRRQEESIKVFKIAAALTFSVAWGVCTAQLPTSPGIHELTHPMTGQRFTLAIPAGHDRATPMPLILSLHYGGRVTPYFGRGLLEALIAPALAELGAMIVAPDNADRGWANAASEQKLIALLDLIESSYAIDRRRTLVTGYSMGGAGTWYMIARHPDRFAAALPMAGRPPTEELESFGWQVPMYVIHSTADERIPIGPTKDAVAKLEQLGADIELNVIDGITHFEMGAYRPHLAAAVPWIRAVWSR
jgi:hypothetical protein